MIITQAPFRVSLFGGGTDYKHFYSQYGAFLVGFAIDKYFYINTRYKPAMVADNTIISYSKQECVMGPDEIEHPLVREAIKYYGIKHHLDLHMSADIPSRTGLGGSSACCVALCHAFSYLERLGSLITQTQEASASNAIYVEREILRESGGIQDQLFAALGGFKSIEIDKHGHAEVKPVPITDKYKTDLIRNHMVLLYTGKQRTSNQVAKSYELNYEYLHKINSIAKAGYKALISERTKDVGRLLYSSWKAKKQIGMEISDENVENLENELMDNGFYGVKLLGSGGGGFMLGIGPQDLVWAYRSDPRALDIRCSEEGVTRVL